MSEVTQTAYKKLCGSRSLLSETSLHAGKHHILYLRREGYGEHYKRFYYDDILAVVSVRTHEYFMLNTMAIAMFLACVLMIIANDAATEWVVAGSIFGGLGLLVLLSNLISGPSVKTSIQTKVNCEEILCLRRKRRCKKVLPELLALVQGAQGGPAAPMESETPAAEVPAAETDHAAAAASAPTTTFGDMPTVETTAPESTPDLSTDSPPPGSGSV